MTKRFSDPIEVRPIDVRGDAAPEHFVWRGRLYRVTELLGRWIEVSAWWRGDGEACDYTVWRVEAAAGRRAPPGVYDVCRRDHDHHWFLARSFD